MTERAVVSIFCVSQPRLLGALADRLRELDCNLADTTYAMLAGSAEFTAVCELPDGLAHETLMLELQRLPQLAGGRVTVSPASAEAGQRRPDRITHRFEFHGPDKPGLIAALSHGFADSGAAVVRLNSHPAAEGGTIHSVIRFAVSITGTPADACISAVQRTAKDLGLTCQVEIA